MNAALIALADHFDATKPGYVRDAVQTHRVLVQLTSDWEAAGDAIRALSATGVFDGAYVPGVRTIARVARQLA